MAEIFVIVRLATLILCGVVLILTIIGLVDVIGHDYGSKTQLLVAHIIALAIMFLGAYGSYINNRVYLYVFALILLIATIVSATGAAFYVSLGFNIILIILAAAQAELLRRGYA